MKSVLDAAARAGVKAIILVEHDMDLVAEYSSRIVALQSGRVLADRAPKEFFADPEIVAAVVGKLPGRMTGETLMLAIDKLVVDIQGSRILQGVSLSVGAGQLVCLVGRNGAGKTTTFRTIMGYRRALSGSIAFEDIRSRRCPRIALRAWAWDMRRRKARSLPTSPWRRTSSCPRGRARRSAPRRNALLAHTSFFPSCANTRHAAATNSRAANARWYRSRAPVALDPRMLLLDEPFEGLSPAIIPSISEGIASIRKLGHAVLMAESNAHHIPEYADALYVLERGEIIYAGKPGDSFPPDVAKVITGGA